MFNKSQGYTSLNQLLATPLGQWIIHRESLAFKRLDLNLRGREFALMGEPAFSRCLTELGVTYQMWLHARPQSPSAFPQVSCQADNVPLQSDSLQAVFLAHCLEQVVNPLDVLREAHRILAPEGWLIISGFNPWSAWGLWFFALRKLYKARGMHELMSAHRIKAGLMVLGFEDFQIEPFLFKLPLKSNTRLKKLSYWERICRYFEIPFGSGAYVMVAKKTVLTLTPFKPEWSLKVDLIPPLLVEPTPGRVRA